MNTQNRQEEIVLIGEVRGADFDTHTFSLRLVDGTVARCVFAEIHAPVITTALVNRGRQNLCVRGVRDHDADPSSPMRVETAAIVAEQLPIWEIALGIAAQMPEEIARSIPGDASENFRSHIYGP